MLTVDNITTHYGQAQIIDGLSLTVERGECVALLGRNGAGKSTTMKAIMGVVRPTRGAVRLNGEDITRWPDYKTARAGVGYVPEDRRIFPELTVLENLQVGQKETKDVQNPWTLSRVFELFPKLDELKHRQGGTLSGGEQQMLTVARTLMGNPELILLDEPTEGLAPIIVQQMVAAIAELKKQGLAILLAEQNQHTIAGLCDRVSVLEMGQEVFAGTLKELEADKELMEKYLAIH